MTRKEKTICEVFGKLDEIYPDASTEWLFAMTEDVLRVAHYIEADAGDISSALHSQHLEEANS